MNGDHHSSTDRLSTDLRRAIYRFQKLQPSIDELNQTLQKAMRQFARAGGQLNKMRDIHRHNRKR